MKEESLETGRLELKILLHFMQNKNLNLDPRQGGKSSFLLMFQKIRHLL